MFTFQFSQLILGYPKETLSYQRMILNQNMLELIICPCHLMEIFQRYPYTITMVPRIFEFNHMRPNACNWPDYILNPLNRKSAKSFLSHIPTLSDDLFFKKRRFRLSEVLHNF